jgi:hypothetical protein
LYVDTILQGFDDFPEVLDEIEKMLEINMDKLNFLKEKLQN